MLKTFWIVLAFVSASSMMTACAQTDDPAGASASQSAEQNAPGQLKPNDSDVMGPWPLNRNYLNAVDPIEPIECEGTIEPKLFDADWTEGSAPKRLPRRPHNVTRTQNQG